MIKFAYSLSTCHQTWRDWGSGRTYTEEDHILKPYTERGGRETDHIHISHTLSQMHSYMHTHLYIPYI